MNICLDYYRKGPQYWTGMAEQQKDLIISSLCPHRFFFFFFLVLYDYECEYVKLVIPNVNYNYIISCI